MFKLLGVFVLSLCCCGTVCPCVAEATHCDNAIVERVVDDYSYQNVSYVVASPHQKLVERVVLDNYSYPLAIEAVAYRPRIVERVIVRDNHHRQNFVERVRVVEKVRNRQPVRNFVRELVRTPARIVDRVRVRDNVRQKIVVRERVVHGY